jgi:hypothetical protein
MNTVQEEQFWLTVRIGGCRRHTETDGELSRRIIELRGCPILSNSLKGKDQPARGDEIDLSIYEADPGQEIGFFEHLGILFLHLPPTAFAEFWTASAAADGAARDLTIQFKNDGPSSYTITKAKLVEHMPDPIDFNPKAHALIRAHPVVAELRDIRKTLAESWSGIVMLFFVLAAFGLVTYLLSSGLGALWKWVNP